MRARIGLVAAAALAALAAAEELGQVVVRNERCSVARAVVLRQTSCLLARTHRRNIPNSTDTERGLWAAL